MTGEREGRHDARECDGALARAFGFLGKRWNGVILAVLLGGPAGFAELKRAVGGISDSVLADRLSELGLAGLVERSVSDGPPVSVSYALTPAGQALLPALNALGKWAADNLPDASARSADERTPAVPGPAPRP